MRALIFNRFGGPQVLEWGQVPAPVLQPGQALVRMAAAGLNFADIYRREGRYHLAGAPPWILGYEGAGVVEAVAPGAVDDTSIRLGTRVGFADVPFANAELVAAPLDRLITLPDELSFDTAAALLLQGLTAQYLCEDSYRISLDETVLVHAAAGGVGLLLIQLAVAAGARVIAVASTHEKRAAAIHAGAMVAFAQDDWRARSALFAPNAVDVVYDSVGSTLSDSLAAARVGGSVVFYGMAGGDPALVDPRLLMDRSLALIGGDLWNVLTSAAVRRSRAARLFKAVTTGKLRVLISRSFPMAEGADAHRFLASRAAIGKVLLTL